MSQYFDEIVAYYLLKLTKNEVIIIIITYSLHIFKKVGRRLWKLIE